MDRVTFASSSTVAGNTLSGVAHAFGERALTGNHYTAFAPGAFDQALKKSDVRAFVNHDTTLVLGRQSNGTVRLSATPQGLAYDIDLPDTSYAADLKALVGRGDVNEMSFGIVPGRYAVTKAADGRQVRTYGEVEQIFDVSPVSMPAFEGTSVQLHKDQSMSEETPIVEAREAVAAAVAGDYLTADAVDAKIAQAFAKQPRQSALGFPNVIQAVDGPSTESRAFAHYLRTGQPNGDLTFAQTEGTTTQGGYLVPQEFRQKLTERLLAFGGLRGEADILSTGDGRPIDWPTVDDTASTYADIAAEGVASAAGHDIVFGTLTLGAFKYAATGTGNIPIKVSYELLQDSAFDVAAFVARALGTRIGRKQAKDLMQGSGSGAPQGLMYGGAVAGTDCATVVETTGVVTPSYANLVDAVHGIDPLYRQNAKWIFNDATLAKVEKMVDGNSRPLLIPSTSGIAGNVGPGSLLGYPVVIDQSSLGIADEVTFMVFGDLREAYIVREVKDVQVLVNPYAATGYIVYDAWARLDGKIQQPYAIAKIEGET